ncbi:hypothetical protein MF672_040545 [Actinomadura sp. ATCC 31491]|uniref:Uncharacterized protein n=1 Tax=Actinomadura luzonensis TaxID=2805427 RepID=A0ABT0G612_9ACTN|nr:hypothetical protein [Actinomadura luzonensis]MCK2220043.1 hypothetical protein [Actinomadura luzonensis]
MKVQQRLATVATATVLGLAGLAGSALADDGGPVVAGPDGTVTVHGDGQVKVHGDGPVKVRPGPGAPGGRMACRARGGKAVKLSRVKVAELVKERVIDPAEAWDLASDGVTVVPADQVVVTLPARELPRRVAGKHWRSGRGVHLTCVWTEFSVR